MIIIMGYAWLIHNYAWTVEWSQTLSCYWGYRFWKFETGWHVHRHLLFYMHCDCKSTSKLDSSDRICFTIASQMLYSVFLGPWKRVILTCIIHHDHFSPMSLQECIHPSTAQARKTAVQHSEGSDHRTPAEWGVVCVCDDYMYMYTRT